MNEAGYKFIKSGFYKYEFYTLYGAAYKVFFSKASTYFTSKHPSKDFIFSADIQLLYPGSYNHYDYIIGITIAEIFFDFFDSDKRNIIFYFCDPLDGKMTARMRKFDFWYRFFGNEKFEKFVVDINVNSVRMKINFLYKKSNIFAADLPDIINEAKDNLSK